MAKLEPRIAAVERANDVGVASKFTVLSDDEIDFLIGFYLRRNSGASVSDDDFAEARRLDWMLGRQQSWPFAHLTNDDLERRIAEHANAA